MITLKQIIDIFIIEYPIPIPEGGSVDTAPYIVAWNKAVADFNRRATRKKNYIIPVVSNIDLYPLPYDYSKMIVIDLRTPSGFTQSEGGSTIPGSTPGYVETYQIEGDNIRFVPMPKYTDDKNLWYGAGHALTPYDKDVVTWEPTTDYEVGDSVLLDDDFIYAICSVAGTSGATEPTWPTDVNEEVVDGSVTWTTVYKAYPEMVEDDAYIILIKAKVFMIQNAGALQAPGGLRYSLGELTIDRTRQSHFTNEAADKLNDQYLAEVKSRIGHLISISYRQAELRTAY